MGEKKRRVNLGGVGFIATAAGLGKDQCIRQRAGGKRLKSKKKRVHRKRPPIVRELTSP